jgi:hypothetical protein
MGIYVGNSRFPPEIGYKTLQTTDLPAFMPFGVKRGKMRGHSKSATN